MATKAGKQAGIDAGALPAPIRRPSDLLDSVVQMGEEATVPTAPGSATDHVPANAPKPARVGSAFVGGAIAPGLLAGGPLPAEVDGFRFEKLLLSISGDGESFRASAGNVVNTIVLPTDTTTEHRHVGNSTPPGLPPPAPESPASAMAGSAGTFFVPLAALLALLALVAPATLRRLGRASDFQVPSRFVCALERPG